jgi:hypothetical protein
MLGFVPLCVYIEGLASHRCVITFPFKQPKSLSLPPNLAASEDKQGTRNEPLQACGKVCKHTRCTIISPVLRSIVTGYRVYTSSANTIGRPLSVLFHSCEICYSSPSFTILVFVVFCHENSRSFKSSSSYYFHPEK